MKNGDNRIKNYWWGVGLSLFFKLSGWIVFPVLLATVVGKWLDRQFQTAPWLFLSTVGVAFIFSMIGMTMNALSELRKIDSSEENSKKK